MTRHAGEQGTGAGERLGGRPEGPRTADAALTALFERIAPDLDRWERDVRAAEPALPDPEVLDRALRLALAHFRHEAGQQTLAYLRWRAEQAKADARATVAASAAARQARAAARATATSADAVPSATRTDAERPRGVSDDAPREFRDAAGGTWSVHEVAAGEVPWAHGPRCLLFGSETAIRRVWHFPSDWRTLSDAELEALSWRV